MPYTSVKRYILVLCVALMIGVSVPLSVHAQSDIAVQKKFLISAITTFLQRASQVQNIIQKRTDIFTVDIQDKLLSKADQSVIAFTGYLNDVASAQTIDELRALAGVIYTYRTTEDALLKQEILSAYFTYFEKTTQRLIISRYEEVQSKIIYAKNQGKDTTSIERIFVQATDALKKLQDTIITLHKSLPNQEEENMIPVSLRQIEKNLEDIQTYVASIYGVFRKISIQGDAILELDTEEQKIQNTLPSW